jgi:hypothetical protein
MKDACNSCFEADTPTGCDPATAPDGCLSCWRLKQTCDDCFGGGCCEGKTGTNSVSSKKEWFSAEPTAVGSKGNPKTVLIFLLLVLALIWIVSQIGK